jgi:hypothetical protein
MVYYKVMLKCKMKFDWENMYFIIVVKTWDENYNPATYVETCLFMQSSNRLKWNQDRNILHNS